MTKNKSAKESDKELLELGKKLKDFYDLGYTSRKDALVFSLLKGIAGGAGAFIGGTVVVALLLWILSFFSEVNFVSEIVDSLNQGQN